MGEFESNSKLAAANEAAVVAAGLWQSTSKPKFISQLENFTYELDAEPNNLILRITEDSHRHVDQITAELEWVSYLRSNNLNVCNALLSINNQLVESFKTEEGLFHATVFEKARGNPFDVQKHWTPEILRNTGELIGKMHALTKRYAPAPNTPRRAPWNESGIWTNHQLHLPEHEVKARRELSEVHEWARNLPTDNDCFGLIHSDVNASNYFIDHNNEISLFDFDDMQYHWFVYDLAVIISNARTFITLPERDLVSEEWFYGPVLEGYLAHNKLSEEWLNRIPAFVRFRRIELYAFIFMIFGEAKISGIDLKAVDRIREDMARKEPLI